MQRWEYRRQRVVFSQIKDPSNSLQGVRHEESLSNWTGTGTFPHPEGVEGYLNEMGEDGWELVSVTARQSVPNIRDGFKPPVQEFDEIYSYFFKRLKK